MFGEARRNGDPRGHTWAEVKSGRYHKTEACYSVGDATSLVFLEMAARESRHYDHSPQFVTHTGGEFTLTPEAPSISSPCSSNCICSTHASQLTFVASSTNSARARGIGRPRSATRSYRTAAPSSPGPNPASTPYRAPELAPPLVVEDVADVEIFR